MKHKFLYTRFVQNLEDFLPPIQSAGLNTQKSVTFGNQVVGQQQSIVSETTNATLTVAQSGATILYASATGMTLTLPAPKIGVLYNLVVANSPTSGTHAIVTDAATTFLQGGVIVATGGGTIATYVADGSTHVAMRMNGTTTAGTLPTFFQVTCISLTKWEITGNLTGSGISVTPFKTS